MIPKVNKEKCIGCGFCAGIAPEVFRMNEENKSEVIEGVDYDNYQEKISQAVEGCPVSAIIAE
jgi:ferredoxin